MLAGTEDTLRALETTCREEVDQVFEASDESDDLGMALVDAFRVDIEREDYSEVLEGVDHP